MSNSLDATNNSFDVTNNSINEKLTESGKPVFAMRVNVMKSLLVCQTINILTLVTQLHWLYLLFATSAIALQWYSYRKRFFLKANAATLTIGKQSIIAPWLVLLMAITGSVVLALTGRELGLLLAMVHLLCFAYSLKMFEISSRKDLYQLVILGVFVVASSLIFLQSIYFSLLVITIVFLNFLVLLYFFGAERRLKQQLALLSKLVLYSLPVAILLFVGFPKVAPFWQVPNVKSTKVGMSDEVKIGDISQLALSNALAFRVSFNGQIPNQNQLYWRSLVLDNFDGNTWRRTKNDDGVRSRRNAFNYDVLNDPNIEVQGAGIDYQVITEPSFQSWLFALDLATSNTFQIGQRRDFGLYYQGIISQTLSYQVTSYPNAVLAKGLSAKQVALNTRFDENRNPLLVAKGRELHSQYQNKRQLINSVLENFNANDYRYTLRPPPVNANGNSLDEFYFQTQAGFCEHYASAFTYLMRAAGIPARMVVGYLGGELNPNGNYMSVYQRDAHAWSEVWLEDAGWVRVDPTAAVNPDRVERGFTDTLLQEHEALSSGFFSRPSIKAMQWLMKIKHQFDALDYQWTKWVIGYSAKQQTDVLKYLKMGLMNIKNILLALAMLTVVFVLYFTVKSFFKSRTGQAKWLIQYTYILSLLAKNNIIKPTSKTAMAFANDVAKIKPDIAEDFSLLSACFCKLSYQVNSDDIEQQKRTEQKMLQAYKNLRWKLKYSAFVSSK